MTFRRIFLGAALVAGSLHADVLAPCTDGAAGENIIPIATAQSTYCISDFGWSDTWFAGPQGNYVQELDVFSGEDSFNVRFDGLANHGYLSPTMDFGTTVPYGVTGVLGAGDWTVVTPVSTRTLETPSLNR